ncbi:MAG TPA: SAM-dependent methyltransferase [Thermoanaerobaculia bacterium]|nr:SAM-dependent methyltransferase [Thermoanaerobaculia bacterium]
MSSLLERLKERIAREGSMSFRDFMAVALYDSEKGYYTVGARIGERGDFVTSPQVSPAFAASVAKRFREDAARLTGPLDFVEAGAGEGRFLEDFAAALSRQDPATLERVRWTAIERSPSARASLERLRLPAALRILESAEGLADGSVTGWIFSNELYDALPVVRVVGTAGGLAELRVGLSGGELAWVRAPAPAAFAEHLARFGVTLETDQAGEISFAAAPLHRRFARALARGRLVAFDYGHRASVLYHPLARRQGTLAVHFAGRRRGDPLSRPGEMDLTAHVNWDDLQAAGEEEGLVSEPIARQGRYLTEAGLFEFAESQAEKWRAYRLVDPEGMGEELSVLVQSRGL